MTQFCNQVEEDIGKKASQYEPGFVARVLGSTNDPCPQVPAVAIPIATCAPFDDLVVKTRNHIYEVLVLSGGTGQVLVRGGRFFPEFRRAVLAGPVMSGWAPGQATITTGFPMELHVDGEAIVTSRVQAVSRL